VGLPQRKSKTVAYIFTTIDILDAMDNVNYSKDIGQD
jgi:hypothetical protein